MADSLNCISVHQHAMRMSNPRNFSNRLNRAYFIISRHHRNQTRFRSNGFFNIPWRNTPPLIDWHIGNVIAQ